MSFGLLRFPTECYRFFLTLFICMFFFQFNLSISNVIAFLLIQIFFIFSFLGLGLISTAIILYFGRGQMITSYLTTIGAIVGGAYFPPDVLPSKVVYWFNLTLPFSSLLEQSRIHYYTKINILNTVFVQSIITSSFYFILGYLAFSLSLSHFKKRDSVLLFTT